MQIIENWTDINGKVVNLEGTGPVGFITVAIEVESSNPVSGFANLFQDVVGKILQVNILLESVIQAGTIFNKTISLRIRQGGVDLVFAHPDMIAVKPD